ncbi:MAG: hypothetical protein ACM3S1_10130 [Hyphomicrobiales bacterium]
MTVPTAEVAPQAPQAAAPTPLRSATVGSLPIYRLNIMRAGYLLMAVGLAAVKWPVLVSGDAASLPVFEGVVAALLGTMSLLWFLALRYPVQMLPLLIFESAWKLVWLAAVGIPNLIEGDMSDEMRSVLFNVSLVVVVLAVTPWDYAWNRYVRAPGDPWR